MPAASKRVAQEGTATPEERIERLEHAVAAMLRSWTPHHSLRGAGVGIEACQELVAELDSVERAMSRDAERERARARLAELESEEEGVA